VARVVAPDNGEDVDGVVRGSVADEPHLAHGGDGGSSALSIGVGLRAEGGPPVVLSIPVPPFDAMVWRAAEAMFRPPHNVLAVAPLVNMTQRADI
jgi:hypothetical protein